MNNLIPNQGEHSFPVLPDILKEWSIREEIGKGSFGKVYLIENHENRQDALKIICVPGDDSEQDLLRREYGTDISIKDYYREKVKEYEQEIRIVQSFEDHSHIVEIYDYYIEENINADGFIIYIHMAYLENFHQYTSKHRMEESDIIKLGIDLCDTLMLCEKNHIIHRDIKPDNILVSKDGSFKLCDFGVAKNLEISNSTYSLKGTLAYMAPEVYLGKKYDGRVDLYSLGIVLYRQLNRKREPFIGHEKQLVYYKDRKTALGKRMDGIPLPIPVDASPEMAQIILKACEYQPENRYASAKDLKKDLVLLSEGKYKKQKRSLNHRKYAVFTTIILLIGGAAFLFRDKIPVLGSDYIQYTLKQDGTLLISGKGALKSIPQKYKSSKYITIDDGITSIGDGVFQENFESLTQVIMSDSVKKIGDSAFSFCPKLNKVHLSDSLTEISSNAFYGCSSLTDIEMPENVNVIGDSAFEDCTSIGTIEFSDTLTTIGESSFMGCTSLKGVNFPDSLQDIKSCAFYDCENLNEILFSSDLKHVGSLAFYNTQWQNQQKKQVVVDGILIYVPEGQPSIELSSTVEIIGDGVCQNYETLKEVTIPESVTEIGEDAFEGCISLEKVHLPDHDIVMNEGAFDGTIWKETKNK